MKIIDAYWEKRNLGVDVKEIEFEKNDTLDVISEFVKIPRVPYMVAKVPSGRNDLAQSVQEAGFKYIESNISLNHSLNEIPILPKLKRIAEKGSYAPMLEKDIEELFSQIERGIFNTDRIYLDPYFTHEIAAKRYINWIKDLMQKGFVPQKVLFGGESVGFFICEILENNVGRGILGGVYDSYKNLGMGVIMEVQSLLCAQNLAAKKFKTNVSSNNIDVVKIMLDIGYKISEIHSVFVKHSDSAIVKYTGRGYNRRKLAIFVFHRAKYRLQNCKKITARFLQERCAA